MSLSSVVSFSVGIDTSFNQEDSFVSQVKTQPLKVGIKRKTNWIQNAADRRAYFTEELRVEKRDIKISQVRKKLSQTQSVTAKEPQKQQTNSLVEIIKKLQMDVSILQKQNIHLQKELLGYKESQFSTSNTINVALAKIDDLIKSHSSLKQETTNSEIQNIQQFESIIKTLLSLGQRINRHHERLDRHRDDLYKIEDNIADLEDGKQPQKESSPDSKDCSTSSASSEIEIVDSL